MATQDIDDVGEYGQSALHRAVELGDTQTVKELLNGGADPNGGDWGYQPPLHIAAELGHVHVAELLLDAGARINIRTWRGTPLHAAVRGGDRNAPMVALLLARGARIEASGGRSHLHLAALGGHTEIAKLLVKAGADVLADGPGGGRFSGCVPVSHPELAKFLSALEDQALRDRTRKGRSR
ncbi:MAG: ankyrin repeat domain-containing protein [Phycisphaerales bacterium]|nr:ankyrin repeat domain-containing protein [Phycisphaerales bacterium]